MKKLLFTGTLLVCGITLMGCSDEPETNSSTNTSTEISSTVVTDKSEDTTISNTSSSSVASSDVNLNDFIDSFENFTTAYASIPNTDGLRTKSWENVQGTQVTWTGTVLEASDDRLYLISNDKFSDGLIWNDVVGQPDAYNVFIAKLNDDINPDNFPNGTVVTVNGILNSRGDETLNYNWDLEQATIVE